MKNTQKARALRKDQTDAEKLLWKHIRNRQLQGYKFRRQVPIGRYIVDFACLSLKLVFELDGSQHMSNTEYYDRRTQFLTKQGFKVVRFWNNELLNQTDSVLEALTLALSRRQRETKE